MTQIFKIKTIFVFKGLGNPHRIDVKTDVRPVFNPPRKVPQSLHKELGKTLSELANLSILLSVNDPTDWASSLVVVENPNPK